MDIQKIKWKNIDAVQLTLENTRMVIITEFGPRIAFYGRVEGKNLLFWDTANRGRKDWLLRGGHRVWIMTQGADESEMTYQPDNDSCDVNISDKEVTVWSSLNKNNMSRKGIRVRAADHNNFEVSSLVTNAGDMLLSCGVWALTCTLPSEETQYAFPLGDNSGWDTFKSVQFRKWGPNDGIFGDSQFRVSSKTLVVNPEGRQAKLMFNVPLGIGVMNDPESGLTFSKHIGYNYDGNYPEGCNFAIYIGPENYLVEFESMGPYSTVKPGDTKEHVEVWRLNEGNINVDDPEAIKRLR